MKHIFDFHQEGKRSCIELTCDIPFDILDECIYAKSQKKLPENAIFEIAKGKKTYDIIFYHEAASFLFYSERIINVLSHFLDMTDKCYPIKIKDCDTQYYVIFNLESHIYINYEYSFTPLSKENHIVLSPNKELPNLFTMLRLATTEEERLNTIDLYTETGIPVRETFIIAISPEIMEAMKKEKITNIDFREWDVYDEDEYAEWKRKHGIVRDY